MKKFTLIIAAMLLTTATFAQKGFSWGAKAGLNLSTITNLKDDFQGAPFDVKAPLYPNFYAGAFAEYRFGKLIGLQLEAVYSRQGGKLKVGPGLGGAFDAKITYKLDYINIPLLVKFYPIEKLSIELGPQFGFVTSAKAKIDGTIADNDIDETRNIPADTYDTFDLSLGMGASYRITKMIEVNARYNLGLTKIITDSPGDVKAMNRVLQIGMGVRF